MDELRQRLAAVLHLQMDVLLVERRARLVHVCGVLLAGLEQARALVEIVEPEIAAAHPGKHAQADGRDQAEADEHPPVEHGLAEQDAPDKIEEEEKAVEVEIQFQQQQQAEQQAEAGEGQPRTARQAVLPQQPVEGGLGRGHLVGDQEDDEQRVGLGIEITEDVPDLRRDEQGHEQHPELPAVHRQQEQDEQQGHVEGAQRQVAGHMEDLEYPGELAGKEIGDFTRVEPGDAVIAVGLHRGLAHRWGQVVLAVVFTRLHVHVLVRVDGEPADRGHGRHQHQGREQQEGNEPVLRVQGPGGEYQGKDGEEDGGDDRRLAGKGRGCAQFRHTVEEPGVLVGGNDRQSLVAEGQFSDAVERPQLGKRLSGVDADRRQAVLGDGQRTDAHRGDPFGRIDAQGIDPLEIADAEGVVAVRRIDHLGRHSLLRPLAARLFPVHLEDGALVGVHLQVDVGPVLDQEMVAEGGDHGEKQGHQQTLPVVQNRCGIDHDFVPTGFGEGWFFLDPDSAPRLLSGISLRTTPRARQ